MVMDKSTLEWLLQPNCPSVRYDTLVDLLERPLSDPEVVSAQRAIMTTGLVPSILDKLAAPENEEHLHRFYHNKYRGLVWQLLVLAELGATSQEQIRYLGDHLLAHSQVVADGGFSTFPASRTAGGRAGVTIPCLAGNMVWALLRLGFRGDPRLERGMAWLIDHIALRDGEAAPEQKEIFLKHDDCWGTHTCFMGAIKPLKGLAAYPKEERTPAMEQAIADYAEFFLIHHVYKRSHDLTKVARPGWQRFAFPLMYQTDVLEILDILTGLGYRDPRMAAAIELVQAKQKANGRWQAENVSLNAKLLHPLSQEEQDKFVTLRAFRVLKRWNAGGSVSA